MSSWSARLRSAHRFLVRQLFYPLLLSTLLACSFFAGRVFLSHTWLYRFLVYNLFLAWIPYLLSLSMAYIYYAHPKRRWYLVILGTLWIVFFPNAPYIVTDFLHLAPAPPVSLLYDTAMLLAFAWSGVFLAIASLNTIQTLVRQQFGTLVSWLAVAVMTGLTGLGIYIGRVLRWNSWDIFLDPRNVLFDVGSQLRHPLTNPQSYGFTIMFAAFLLVCYLMFTSMQHRQHT